MKTFEEFSKYGYEGEYHISLAKDIYAGAPNIHFKNKNYAYVIERLRKLIGKYVNFCSDSISEKDGRTIHNNTIYRGFVEDVAYDNVGGNKISYIKLKGKDWLHINKNDDIIHVIEWKSDAEKYNL
jgi:hypothetical protein